MINTRLEQDELNEKLKLHMRWLERESDGVRLRLTDTRLTGNIDLRGAQLQHSVLHNVRGRGVKLIGANLSHIYMRGCWFRQTDMTGARLSHAHLYTVVLDNVILNKVRMDGTRFNNCRIVAHDMDGVRTSHETVFRDTSVRTTPLDANTYSELACATRLVPSSGDVIGWKRCQSTIPDDYCFIVKLRIPSDARRSNGFQRQCRAEYADVLEITPYGRVAPESGARACSLYDPTLIYEVGKRVTASGWDTNRFNDCTAGIHFYLTQAEARHGWDS